MPKVLYLPVIALFASVATAAVLWATLRLALVRQRLATPRVERIFTRFMGLILVAIGFQIGMLGIRDFFGLGGT